MLTKQQKLNNKPLLIICNKCDSPNFVSSQIIANDMLKIQNSWNSPCKIIETSVKLKTTSILDEGIMFLLYEIDENYDLINQTIELNHQKSLKDQDTKIRMQKQRVQQLIHSPSSKVSPKTVRKYSNLDGKNEQSRDLHVVELEKDVAALSRISIIRHHEINRPSSAPLHVIRRYVIDNDKRESSL